MFLFIASEVTVESFRGRQVVGRDRRRVVDLVGARGALVTADALGEAFLGDGLRVLRVELNGKLMSGVFGLTLSLRLRGCTPW